MTTKLEQVAEAIFWAQVAAEEREVLGQWEFVREERKAVFRAMAIAAIEAMKGPTPEMVEAGAVAGVDGWDEHMLERHRSVLVDTVVPSIFDAMLLRIPTHHRRDEVRTANELRIREQASKDREALYAALDIIEEIVTDRFFEGSFGDEKMRLVKLNAERRARTKTT